MHDHKSLGQRRNEIQKMVNAISLVAATSRNVQVFKWALWNNFYIEELWRQYEVFRQVTKEWTHRNTGMGRYEGHALVPPRHVG
jgi:hypothetical protein